MCEVYKENECVTLLMYTDYRYKEFEQINHFLLKFVTGKGYVTQNIESNSLQKSQTLPHFGEMG